MKKSLALIVALLMLLTIVVTSCKGQKDKDGQETGNVEDQFLDDNVEDEDKPDSSGDDEDGEDQPEDEDDLDETDETDDEIVEEPEGDYLYIKADRLNIREEPSPQGEKVGSLVQGNRVIALGDESLDGEGRKWIYIQYKFKDTLTEGWIVEEFAVEKPEDYLAEGYKGLDLSPQDKVDEFEDNPRIKVRGVYLTAYSASGARLDELIEMTKTTDINTFVIDVKDDVGNMLFKTEAADKFAPEANDGTTIKDPEAFMKKLKDNDIYTIARIVTFKDPIYALAHPERAIFDTRTGKAHIQSDGLSWASPHDRQLWEYDVAVAKEAARLGFNEIQFDYVRFPDSGGGKLDSVLDYKNTENESKPETIQNFLKYAYSELSPEGVYVGADIYGLVGSVPDDMGLGQHWEAISNVVDYVCPMMYPSHYAQGTYDLEYPDAKPYETVYQSTLDAAMRNDNLDTPAIIRPWIQDFTASWVKGYIEYGPQEVKAQIKALEDNDVDEYMLWNSSNRYSEDGVR